MAIANPNLNLSLRPFYFSRAAMALGAAASLSGCSHSQFNTLSKYSIELPAILEQVNDSIQAAKKINGNEGPDITGIELDLQVESETNTSASIPLILVTPETETDNQVVHQISVSFKPKPVKFDGPIDKTKVSELTSLIAAIDSSVANANPIYNFEKGSVKIQCTFKQTVGADASGKVHLTPIQIGAKHSHQSIQTITLSFLPHVANEVPPAVAPPVVETVPVSPDVAVPPAEKSDSPSDIAN